MSHDTSTPGQDGTLRFAWNVIAALVTASLVSANHQFPQDGWSYWGLTIGLFAIMATVAGLLNHYSHGEGRSTPVVLRLSLMLEALFYGLHANVLLWVGFPICIAGLVICWRRDINHH